jgi:hypothetical protein
MFDDYEDDRNDRLATPSEAISEYAANAGRMFPDRAWLLTDWDVWVANPFYQGPKVRHPEEDDYEDDADCACAVCEVWGEDDLPF